MQVSRFLRMNLLVITASHFEGNIKRAGFALPAIEVLLMSGAISCIARLVSRESGMLH
jgi:hypothetical protein